MMNKKVIAVALALALAGGSYAQDDTAKKKVKAYMVSDAHLDTQWNWDIQTTINEYVWNTISQNLFLLKKYPEYVFNFEGGVKYAWMKEYYPEQYEEMKKFIEEGRWHAGLLRIRMDASHHCRTLRTDRLLFTETGLA